MGLRVLTEDDLRFFQENGYVVIHNAVPPENLQAVIDAMFTFLGMDPNNPDDWYRLPLTPGGMIEMYQHQALWDNRQHPRIHGAFTDLLGTEKLWVTFDRANLKPPFHPDHPNYNHGGFLHWDIDTSKLDEIPFGVQGVLYLSDTGADMGGFHCVPGHHRTLSEWIKTQPADRHPRVPKNPEQFHVTPIPGKAGDLVIWDKRLLHGNGRNLSQKPRLAQYIAMFPVPTGPEAEERREDRVMRWRERVPPAADWVVGDPRNWEKEQGQTAELTQLGRRLLGLETWD